jgi:hypothetical protein
MLLKTRDTISLIVDAAWAEAVDAEEYLGRFPGSDPSKKSASARFMVRVFSIDDSEGLWIESKKLTRLSRKGRPIAAIKMLVPWHYIWSIVSHPSFEARRSKIGFEDKTKP